MIVECGTTGAKRGAERLAGPGLRGAVLCVLGAMLLVLHGCSGATRRVSVERPVVEPDGAAAATKPAASAPAPRSSRGGGYYQDDGPGDKVPANLDRIEDAEPRLEPLHRFANNPYMVFGQQYVPYKALTPYRQRGIGSWYGRKFHGQRTSSGEIYDMYAMTAAHATLPIPSYARVTSVANGRSVIVRLNDRGPFHSGRLIDLSYAAANRLGYAGAGSAVVEVESILPEEFPVLAARRRRAGQPVIGVVPPPGEPPPIAEAKPISPVILAAASILEPGIATPAQPIPVDAEASGIYLQLGAFSGRDNAENFRVRVYQQLTWLGDAIQIYSRDGMFRLHLGPYRDREEAGRMAERIREALQFKPHIVVR
jgi:rare lipoprotein A